MAIPVDVLKKMSFIIICGWCKSVEINKIWHRSNPEVEQYITKRLKLMKCGVSHGLCPVCYEEVVQKIT